MKWRNSSLKAAARLLCWIVAGGFCPPGWAADIPPPAAFPIDFLTHVEPILANKCTRCHSGHKRKGGLSIDARASIIKGGESGPAVVVGRSDESRLIRLVALNDPDERMPAKGQPLTDEQIGILRAWIDQGLQWPDGFSFSAWHRAPLAPRTVALPPGEAANPIDRLLQPYFVNLAAASVTNGSVRNGTLQNGTRTKKLSSTNFKAAKPARRRGNEKETTGMGMRTTWLFLGRFHLVVLYLSIGLLIGVALVEALARRRRSDAWRVTVVTPLLYAGAASAVAAALLGLMLATGGGYEQEALFWWHKVAGVTLALLSLAATWLYRRTKQAGAARAWEWDRAYLACLALVMLCLPFPGYLGGTLTFGGDEGEGEKDTAPAQILVAQPQPQHHPDTVSTDDTATKASGQIISDRIFARRVSLDLVGLLPTPDELKEFIADTRPDKRERFVSRLLADKKAYTEHWLTFWSDMLRNAYKGTGYIDGGRKPITKWLYQALYENKPYDRLVHELVSPSPEAEGFIKGIKWRGAVNASQGRAVQAAQNVSQVFLGTNLKCASCHDSFINYWRLADTWSLAAVFADKPLEMYLCDKATGETARPAFLYPELGTIDPKASRKERMRQVADMIVSRKNGRLARTLVNRLWAKLFGRGIVEPLDDLDQAAWNQDLLDWLATDFMAGDYDIKRTLLLMCTSRAYQRTTVGAPSPKDGGEFVFRGPLVKRMDAEQFVDAISILTQTEPGELAANLPLTLTIPDAAHGKILFDSGVMKKGIKTIDVDISGTKVLYLIVTDGDNRTKQNWANWGEPTLTGPSGAVRLTSLQWHSATTDSGTIQIDRNIAKKPMRLNGKPISWGIGTRANSTIVYKLPDGHTRFKALVGPDTANVKRKRSRVSIRFMVMTADELPANGKGHAPAVRTSLTNDDALTRALGRPNREQVVTRRDSIATTLQMITLTNGKILHKKLQAGATYWLRRANGSAAEIIDGIFALTLGRSPRPSERETALGLIGSPPSAEGVTDLLWVMVMLPEFQLIR